MPRIAVALVLLVVASVECVDACDYVVRSHRHDFRRARAVFIGRVVGIGPSERIPAENELGDRGTYMRVRFEVLERFKGPRSGHIVCIVEWTSNSCGIGEMQLGDEYIIYARGRDLYTWGVASRTRRVAAQVLAYEGELDGLRRGRLLH